MVVLRDNWSSNSSSNGSNNNRLVQGLPAAVGVLLNILNWAKFFWRSGVGGICPCHLFSNLLKQGLLTV